MAKNKGTTRIKRIRLSNVSRKGLYYRLSRKGRPTRYYKYKPALKETYKKYYKEGRSTRNLQYLLKKEKKEHKQTKKALASALKKLKQYEKQLAIKKSPELQLRRGIAKVWLI